MPVRTFRSRGASAWTALLLASVLLGGSPPAPAAPGKARQAAPSGVQWATAQSLRAAVARHRGKVVLVNLWATWCPPCVHEFPALVKLQEAYRSRGVVVIAVSLDEPSDRGKVAAFVQKQKARFPVYIRKSGEAEQLVAHVAKGWSGAVPATFLYGRDGKQVGLPIVGARPYDQFVEIVKTVL